MPRRARPSDSASALPGTDELYRLLVENVTDYAIFVIDVEGRVATWTEGAERQMGYSGDEILGRHLSALYPPEDVASGSPGRDLHTAATEGRCEGVAWRVRKDGSRIWVSVVITAIRDDAGRVIGYGQINRDLTERREVARRYEESRQRYRSLFENNPNGVCSFDLDGTLRTANPAAAELAGYPEDDLVALSFWPLVSVEDREMVHDLFGRATAGEPGYGETSLIHRLGRRVRVRLTFVPIRVEGEVIGVYCIAEDITERKRAEAEREALLLRERVARAEAEAASRAKTDFLAVVSHELKTPLNIITGFADLLHDGDAGPLSDVQRRHVERIQSASRQLLQLIDELLSYTRLESGPEAPLLQPVDVGAALRYAAAEAQPAAREKGLEVKVLDGTELCVALTDPARLRRLLQALVSNAVKFTESGEILVQARRESSMLAVTVTDTGIGIAEEHMERIWEPFWQVEHPLVRRAGGTGLGLSLARRLVELLGGDIEVRSAPGAGTTFTVRLPVHDG
jgi:PAS domain S-box-containing protein